MKTLTVSLIFVILASVTVGAPTNCCYKNDPPRYPVPPPPKAVVFHAQAPTMTTYTIHTYHSPAPTPKPSAPVYPRAVPPPCSNPSFSSPPPYLPSAAPPPCSSYKK